MLKEPSLRQKQVSEVIRRLISEYLLELNSIGVFLTCTRVNISPDMLNLKVFLSDALLKEGDKIEICNNIDNFAKKIKALVAQKADLRRTPSNVQIEFEALN